MKKLTKVTLMALMLLGAGQLMCEAKTYKTWKQPHVLKENIGCLKLKDVVFTDTATIVHFVSENNPNSIRFTSATMLVGDDKKQYMIRGCKEYKLDTWMPVDKKVVPVTLWFEPLPKNTKVFDLVEGMLPHDFKVMGITEAKKPYKIKPYAFCEDSIKEFRKNFFRTDTATLKGRIMMWPSEGYEGFSFSALHANRVTCQDEPWNITINKDGTFERKMLIDHPTLEYATGNGLEAAFPFFLMPGRTLDLTYNPFGVATYNDPAGNALPWGKLGSFSPMMFGWMACPQAYELRDKMDFKQFGALVEADMNDKLQFLDYVAERYDFGQLDYYLTRLCILAACGENFLDYPMFKSYDLQNDYSKIDSLIAANDPIAQLYDVDNYTVLRKLPADDPLLLAVPEFRSLENKYQFTELMRKAQNDCYKANNAEGVDSAKIEVDRRIFGFGEPSMLMKSALTNNLIFEARNTSKDITMKDVTWDDFPEKDREEKLKFINERRRKVFNKRIEAIQQPFFEAKVKKVFDNYCSQQLVHELPDCEATKALRKLTDKYLGKYLFIDFWATSCGPCRSGIEHSEAVRKQLQGETDFDFLYITDKASSPKKAYDEYVAKHLQGEDCAYVTAKELAQFQELFKFLAIPHYVLLDPQGRMLDVNAEYTFACESVNDFRCYFKQIKDQVEK